MKNVMTVMRIFLNTALLVISFIGICRAEPVDVRSFSLLGVTLGMTAEQAVSGLAHKLQLSEKDIEFEAYPGRNAITPTPLPNYLKVHIRDSLIKVYFQPAVPYNPAAPMLVSQVVYMLPAVVGNMDTIRKAAIDNYGPPSAISENQVLQWCAEPDQGTENICLNKLQPYLICRGTSLILYDPGYQHRVVEYVQEQRKSEPLL